MNHRITTGGAVVLSVVTAWGAGVAMVRNTQGAAVVEETFWASPDVGPMGGTYVHPEAVGGAVDPVPYSQVEPIEARRPFFARSLGD